MRRAEAGAPPGGHIVGAGAGEDGARAPAACAPVSLSCASSGRADRKLRALHAWLPAGPGAHLRWVGVPGLEEIGDQVDRGVDCLARALVPRRVYSVWRGFCVDLAWRLGDEGGTRAEIAPRTEAEIAPQTEGH